MSNERSPRDVCSITIGINGLMSGWLLAAGGPQFRLCRRFFLVRGPDPLARLGLLGGDTLDVRDDAVEGSGQADVLALGLDLRPDAVVNVGAQLVERVELGGRARKLVVQRWQHLLLDLLHRRLDAGRLLVARARELDVLGLARPHADELLLELRNQPAR